MNSHDLHRLRAAVASRGLTPATWLPEASQGRAEEAAIRPARLIEGSTVRAIPVGEAEPWEGPVAFLDGTQHYDFVAHAGAAPVVIATISAAVRERNDRRLRTVARSSRTIVVGRGFALEQAGEALGEIERVSLPDEGPVHPIKDLLAVRRVVDRERGRLEIAVSKEYAAPATGWLIVDGSLSDSPEWSSSPTTLGIAKSHTILPFEGKELEAYLHLPCGHRSPVFAPTKSQVAPVYSWALRLWPWEGHDLFYGLIRVEARPGSETLEQANRISQFLMAERAPLSAPDARWDRLLYGFRTVEELLKA